MRKGSYLAGLVIGASLAASGCQALYGNKPEKPYAPRPKRAPVKPAETVVEYKPIDECQASFHDPPIKAPTTAQNLRARDAAVANAEAAASQAAKTTDAPQRVNYLKAVVEAYRSALQKDPYNADLTLKLAVAYDNVYRKGCALALLRRIASMSTNLRYPLSVRTQDDVEQNTTLFSKYRTEAVAAVGR